MAHARTRPSASGRWVRAAGGAGESSVLVPDASSRLDVWPRFCRCRRLACSTGECTVKAHGSACAEGALSGERWQRRHRLIGWRNHTITDLPTWAQMYSIDSHSNVPLGLLPTGRGSPRPSRQVMVGGPLAASARPPVHTGTPRTRLLSRLPGHAPPPRAPSSHLSKPLPA